MPIFLTAEQARHQAVWQLPFLLTQRDQVTLWRPDRPQQVVSLPAGASWRPTAASFVTDWSGQHARWAPMPWIPDTGLHLCLRSDEANRANVVLWNRSPVCRQLARSPPPTHVVRGTANMDPSDVLLRDGDVLTPRVPASRSTLLRPLWPLLLTLWGCRGCCLDGEAPRTLLLFLWVAYGLSSAPANALVFSPESRAEPASERWSKPYSGSHIDLGSVTPPRPTSVAQAIAGSSLRLCYLRPHGAPVWRRHSSSCWEADITPAGQLQEKLYEFWLADDLPTSLPSRVPWKLQQAWYAYPTWTCGVPEQVLISTDGTGLHTGAWAFVAWGWHAGQWYRLGWEHGVVCQQWSIAPGLLSYAAELAALQTAALWACVWLDANAAAWHTKPTVITAAVDNSVLRPVMPRLWPGHAGFVVNELVDALAGLAAKHGNLGVERQVHAPHHSALWAEAADDLWLVPYGRVVDGTRVLLQWDVPMPEAATASRHVEADDIEEVPPAPKPAHLAFRAVQANIQSIKDTVPHFFNRTGSGQRRAYLHKQLRDLQVHLVTLQECRSRQGRWVSGDFLTWRSGADRQGQYGCEIWLRSDWVPHCDSLDAWVIVCSTPQMLVIKTRSVSPPLCIVSAHAPHADRPSTEISAFWGALGTHLSHLPSDATLMLGVDANADFAASDVDDVLVGRRVTLQAPRLGDDKLAQLSRQARLVAPATFTTIHHGHDWTWQHASGLSKRLDHWLVSEAQCRVSYTAPLPVTNIPAVPGKPGWDGVSVPGDSAQDEEELWDCTSNPQMWLGGYGNSPTDRVKHVAKRLPQKPGEKAVSFKACAGGVQCVVLSSSALSSAGQEFVVEARLEAALKRFDFYVGLVGHHGLGTFEGEVFVALGSHGTGATFVCRKYNTEDAGSCSSGDMPSLTVGDSIRMNLRIGEEEDSLSYMVNDDEVTQPTILETITEPRGKATANGADWKGWRPFIAITGATVSVEVLNA
ncbi:unnamed protein product [Symbiodinium natans]|uniref:Endonuclease/exonuclease/phosphatase domain-containing protein n=1 Tax=Symbiodinium natans TaxID=878477 RepID=A0A812SRU4_9DINO|nr:unnamed protein product [Symbiodinium natans]